MKIESYPFSTCASPIPPDIFHGQTPEQFLASKYQRGYIFGLDNLKRYGSYKLHGWNFNFRPVMKKFLVKQHGYWEEVWARNKTAIRNSTYGRIEAIQEFK